MDILLLGGSNTGAHDGWAAQFEAIVPEHRVTNRFLGAVGSLYGLMRLLRLGEGHEPPPQLVIFEYALNDAWLLDAGWLRVDLLEDTLREVAELCRERSLPLLLLCLQPRPHGTARVAAATRRAMTCYRRLAERHGLHPCVTLDEALGGVRFEDYVNQLHLTPAASIRVAEHLAATLRGASIPVPRSAKAARPSFRFVPAREPLTSGPCRRVWSSHRKSIATNFLRSRAAARASGQGAAASSRSCCARPRTRASIASPSKAGACARLRSQKYARSCRRSCCFITCEPSRSRMRIWRSRCPSRRAH